MGYESGHYKVKMNKPDPNMKIIVRKFVSPDRPMGFYCDIRINDLFLNIPTYIPFKAANNSTRNELAATIHRYGCKMDPIDDVVGEEFVAFCRLLIPKYWTDTVHDDDVLGLDDWLKKTNYPGVRKSYFTRLLDGLHTFDERTCEVESFIKDEEYSEPKNARAINSYSDESKVILGPVCHAIDKKTFQKDVFIKGMDIKNLPDRMKQKFGTQPLYNTDFTSMEAHHRGIFAYVIYFWMMHMTRHLTGCRWLRTFLARLVLGLNNIKFKWIRVQILTRLMSGAFWTSSANAVLNFLLISYMSAKCKHPKASVDELVQWVLKDFTGLFEGDDGLFPVYGSKEQYEFYIKKLGLRLSLEYKIDYTRAGFCSLTCSSEGTIVKDPLKTVQNFFVLPMKYSGAKKSVVYGLLRARALSYLHLFPTAPIVSALCHAVLRDTKSYHARFDLAVQSYFMRGESEKIVGLEKELRVRKDVSLNERILVQEVFKVDVQQQLVIEKAFDSPAPYKIDLLHLSDINRVKHVANFLTFDPRTWAPPKLEHTHENLKPFLKIHNDVRFERGTLKRGQLPGHVHVHM